MATGAEFCKLPIYGHNLLLDRIGVEKMCLTEKSVLEEFGDGAKALLKNAISEGATCHSAEFNGFRSYFCICASSLCNKPPVSALVIRNFCITSVISHISKTQHYR